VQVYFGRGKGKTTAALGQGFRATGHGFKVYMIQFMKGYPQYGEVKAIEKTTPGDIDFEEGRKGMEFAEKIIMSDEYDIVVLDEIGVAVEYGIVKIDDVLQLIDNKPEKVELIITGGPKMHPKIKERADLLTEMRMIKHYYSSKGIKARFGIEH